MKTAARELSPAQFDAVIFDLDGVVTKTAQVHAAAWKRLFDEFLRTRSAREGVEFRPFDMREDYLPYVDGKPRYDGVRSFLKSRGIHLPSGSPEDDAGAETICGLGNRKNGFFRAELAAHGVEPYETTIRFIRELRARTQDGDHFGDDITDEDAFAALRGRGIGIVVRDEPRETAARLALENAGDVHRFLAAVLRRLEGERA